MKCSKCNAEIADNAKFCPICGTKVEIENKCPNCGATIKKDAKFCPECGGKIEKECKCPECGVEVKEGTKFCPKCGAKIDVGNIDNEQIATFELQDNNNIEPLSTQQSETLTGTKSKLINKLSRKEKILIVSAVVTLIVIGIIVILVNNNSDNGYGSYSSSSSQKETYSNEYFSFKYPSDYKIINEDNEYGSGVECEIKGTGVSSVEIYAMPDASLYILDEQETKEVCKIAISSANKELRNNPDMSNLIVSKMTKKTIGNCSGYSSDYTGIYLSKEVNGYIFYGIYGYYLIGVLTCAENDKYTRQLDNILRTLDVVYEPLGIGDADDDIY